MQIICESLQDGVSDVDDGTLVSRCLSELSADAEGQTETLAAIV